MSPNRCATYHSLTMNKSFVISGTWGEYDDYTKVPMFVCNSVDEAYLFCESLNAKEKPFYESVLNFFGDEKYIPNDIFFIYDEVPILRL